MLSFRKKRSIWDSLSVGQYQQINDLKHLDEWNQIRSLVAIVDGINFDIIDSMPLLDLKKRAKEINDELKKIPFTPFKKYLILNKKRYYITRMFDEIQTGQFVELMEWLKDKENILMNLDKIIASLLIESPRFKQRKLYDGTNHKNRCIEIQNHMLMIDAFGLSNFFLTTWIQFCNNIPEFLGHHMNQLKNLKPEPDLKNNSVGW